VHVLAQANREKETVRIAAEAAAQESLVKQVKSAEASEEAAKFRARERTVTADAELDTADKLARAKIRLAEGTQAEAAAAGLADARVREAQTIASEKQGMVEARVALEKLQSEAVGREKVGLAEARVTLEKLQADAAGQEKLGLAAARVTLEQLQADAIGREKQGMADARVKEAEASAVEKRGAADASALRDRMNAEATGIAQKAASMKALDEAGRGHEEFRLTLDKQKTIELEELHVRRDVAASQAEIMSRAFANAKINIVGGDGQFFDKFVRAVSVGQSMDAAVDNGATIRSLLAQVTGGANGERLSVASLLERMMEGADPGARAKIEALAARSKELGVDALPPG
jgi:hypothetical protein